MRELKGRPLPLLVALAVLRSYACRPHRPDRIQRGELRFEDSVSFAGETFAKQRPDASGQCLDVGRIVPQDKMDVVGVLRLLPLVEGKGLDETRSPTGSRR